MRIISLNANGIRAAARKGFFDWMAKQKADVVCIQETKAQRRQLTDPVFTPPGHHAYYHDARKPGYSGVAVYTPHEPRQVIYGMGLEAVDVEGRYLQLDFANLSVISLYLPSGSSSDVRQSFKYQVMDDFLPRLRKLRRCGREVVLCGDWNIAHKQIDLKNWKSNQKNSGFLPDERAWMDLVFGRTGFRDAFRLIDDRPEQYTWWSNRGRAWDNNVGWRIDYQVATPKLAQTAQTASIYREQRFSDHAPLTIDYDWTL